MPRELCPSVHPITAIDADRVLSGRRNPAPYANAQVDASSRTIVIHVSLVYREASLHRRVLGLSRRVEDQHFDRYVRLASDGLSRYWSRNISLNGDQYAVSVTAKQARNGMPLMLSHPGSALLGPMSCRSSNPYPLLVGNVYYDAACGADADRMFAMTAAHEIGHAFLTSAFGIRWSWGHQGTSSILGGIAPDVPPYPHKGEIDLMTYYRQNPEAPVYRDDVLRRTVASENDVKTLLYIAARR